MLSLERNVAVPAVLVGNIASCALYFDQYGRK